MGCLLIVCMVSFCVYQPSPASSGGSGSSTASPPPAASMGTTASSKLGPAQGESCRTRCMHGLPTDCVHGFILCVAAQPSQQRQQRQQYRVTTTGREHGDDGIEQAGTGTR
ncbi:hypothetical protein PF003_g4960 [Phytophthora fragariae]|nr:hypothetical protein PF003_g4960 [Phytophthora fragariae]